MIPPTGIKPVPLNDYPTANDTDDEIIALQTLARAGVQVAPVVVVVPEIEEHFYRTNNLPAQLAELYRAVDPSDPDEDDVEDASPAALALLKEHYLLDETIDLFYAALTELPSRLQVRRPGTSGYSATRGRPTLMHVKQLWQDDWTFDAVMTRLETQQVLGLEARPVLLHPAGDAPSLTLTEDASRVLGSGLPALGNGEASASKPGVEVWAHPEYGVTRVLLTS